MKYNSDGNYVMSGHADRSVRLWNSNLTNSSLESGPSREIAIFDGAHNRDIFDICIFADNEKFVTCGGDKLIFLWDVLKGTWIRKIQAH